MSVWHEDSTPGAGMGEADFLPLSYSGQEAGIGLSA